MTILQGTILLREYFKETSKPVEDFADEAGYTEGYIYKILRGEQKPKDKPKFERLTNGFVPITSWYVEINESTLASPKN